MAGLWNLSQQQLYDQNGKPMVGAKAYFYLGGTTTPITVYKAFALGSVNAHPNPVVTDGFGRWPTVYMDEANGFYRVRVTTAGGVIVFDEDGIPIIGQSGGGGGGGDNPVNPTAVFSTGDLKARYDTDFVDGWVRLNARTIGSATSGASERANADTQALFEYLWHHDNTLVVVGGRGSTANADWLANKQITLPDGRGRVLVGLDTMGNIAAGNVAAATDLGWIGGEGSHTLIVNEMPSHTHTGQATENGNHRHTIGADFIGAGIGSTGGYVLPDDNGNAFTSVAGNHIHALDIDNAGGGLGHNNVQPSMAITLYIKL
jgi:microcystin-dependent protein